MRFGDLLEEANNMHGEFSKIGLREITTPDRGDGKLMKFSDILEDKIVILNEGASSFSLRVKKSAYPGKSPEEIFKIIRANAVKKYGDEGYTGTIAEKDSVKRVPTVKDYNIYFKTSSHFSNDKYSPCAVMEDGDSYVFFGMAAE